ncbi:MAG TPA: threonine synthase [Blastocatellia bacterium]|nr:threonine synthase [Blastocatellia bacterium]
MPPKSRALLRCSDDNCRAEFPSLSRLYCCPNCGGLLDLEYDFEPPRAASKTKALFEKRRASYEPLDRSGVWRFRELLPFIGDYQHVVTLAEGNTPIYDAPRAAQYAGLDRLTFKHQGMNPTGSFKDNGMTTGVTQARVLGANAVACASTGNTSASMAAYAARAGMRAFVFVPAGQISYGKLSQSLEYGARVIEIEGNFDDAMRIVRELAEETDLYLLNSINPFRLEGQKTIIIELMEQRQWVAPDWIVLPGGNLGNTSAFGKALHELSEFGFIDRMPRLAVIQAEGASPFYDLFTAIRLGAAESALEPLAHPATLATAIKIGNPISWKKALRALRWTGGLVERVSEQEIADAKAIIGRDGIGCEPASAATLAGIKRLAATATIAPADDVVAILTGSLLKDPDYTIGYHTGSLKIEADRMLRDIKGIFANRSARVAADKEAIKRMLAEERAE